MDLPIGTRLGPYEIEEKLGEGGMGVVYKARDTRLRRTVALKFLATRLTADREVAQRFEREAQATAALNHPNIITIHEIGEHEGRIYLCMEFIEGGTLRDRMAEGALPLTRALAFAEQIAEGLAAAHGAGIVHRDLKPENVLITSDGRAKLVDFGLAKLAGRTQLTKDASILGTVAYMSPEQIRGLVVDERTDVWALGVVFFEMLSGRHPFRGELEQALAYGIVNEEPLELRPFVPGLPDRLEGVVLRALSKAPSQRQENGAELLNEIESAAADFLERQGLAVSDLGERRLTPKLSGSRQAGLVTAVLLILVLVSWLVTRVEREPGREAGEEPGFASRSVQLVQETFEAGLEQFPAFSPEGTRLAYAGESGGFRQIYVKNLRSGEIEQLTSTEADNIQPAWSADGKALYFVRARGASPKLEPGDVFGALSDGDIWMLDLETGKESQLLQEAFGPDVSPDGKRLAFDASWSGPRRIWISDERGRNPRPVSFDSSEAVSQIAPRWSPHGSRIVFQNIERTILDIRMVELQTGLQSWVTRDLHQDAFPTWDASGESVVFSSPRGGGWNLWRSRIDPSGPGAPPPVQITTGPGKDVQAAVSPDGSRLAFVTLNQNADLWKLPVDPRSGKATGSPEPVVSTTREDSRGAWSRDGNWIAFNSDRAGPMNLWVVPAAGGRALQVTEGPGGDYQPTWSAYGEVLAFFSSRAGNADIWTVELESKSLSRLTSGHALDINPCFSPDGSRIAYQSDPRGRLEVWVMNRDGSGARALTDCGVRGHFLRWSDDGLHVLFRREFTASPQIYRVSVEGGDPELVGEVRGGSHISFSPDQKRLIDVTGHKTLWVTLLPGGRFEKVFEFENLDIRIDYPEWSPDGNWVLFDRNEPKGGDIWSMTLE